MSRAKSNKGRKKATAPAVRHAAVTAGMRSRLRPWMMVAIIVLLTVAVRIRLLGIPLERDEGEYAYGGQLLLQGIPPYKLIFSMKFPGIYAAYAAMMAVFGQTIVGIHLGFMLVNAAAIVLIYLLGKRLLTPAAAVVAAAAYALLSIGEGLFGSQAHATHFVVLAALGATLLLLRFIETRRWQELLLSGVLYGIAVLMKQHGLLFVLFGASYLAWDHLAQRRDGWRVTAKDLALYFGGVLLPLVLTGLALWRAGVFDNFWFWTITYARAYAQEVQLSMGIKLFNLMFPRVVGADLAIWLIALAGLVLIWWRKEDRVTAIFISGFLVFSFLAVCPGLYFREHYFVLMLPVVALLAGAAVDTFRKQWPGASWLPYSLFAAALVYSVLQQRAYLFEMSPLEISRQMYGANPFPEAVEIAGYIRTHTAKDSSIAILGSEPEIPFYAHRRSVTGHIYMYGLMEAQPYALTMQKELIHQVEISQPDYVVEATSQASWLRRPTSSPELSDWWDAYQPLRYTKIVGLADIVSPDHTEYRWGDVGDYHLKSSSALLIYKRTAPQDFKTAQLFYQADTLLAQGKLDEAVQAYRQVLAEEPGNFIAHDSLGGIFDRQGLIQEALKEYRLSLASKPGQAIANAGMGRIFLETHKIPEAVEALTQALRFDPDSAHAHNDLGVALFDLGNYEKAVEQFREVVQIDPDSEGARKNLEVAQARLKNGMVNVIGK